MMGGTWILVLILWLNRFPYDDDLLRHDIFFFDC